MHLIGSHCTNVCICRCTRNDTNLELLYFNDVGSKMEESCKDSSRRKCLEAADLHSVATECDHIEVAVLVNRRKKK